MTDFIAVIGFEGDMAQQLKQARSQRKPGQSRSRYRESGNTAEGSVELEDVRSVSGVRAAKKGANTAGAELQEAVGAATGREREYS